MEIIENFTTSDTLLPDIERAHEIEHAADKVCHSIFQAVSVDFITPIDREDIISLTQSMDDILDYMEATIQRFYMFNLTSMHPRAIDFARLLLKSCEALKVAMGEFRNFKNSKKLPALIVKVGDAEEEMDSLFFTAMHGLYRIARGRSRHLHLGQAVPAHGEHGGYVRARIRHHGLHYHEVRLRCRCLIRDFMHEAPSKPLPVRGRPVKRFQSRRCLPYGIRLRLPTVSTSVLPPNQARRFVALFDGASRFFP
ncbi:MAG: DUF47 domain-containing protein [Slackia sp.]